ncbi:MAG: hypothetical protein L0220_15450 [Acidobacteria bacterium]|nr:hypothetical protein [Acidobacteriota bacterium]
MTSNNQLSRKFIALTAILISLSLFTLAQSRVTRKAFARKISAAPVPNVTPATKSAKSGPKDAPQSVTAASLPLRRIILYSNGVAYFERRGPVTNRSEINLSFKQSQVDDVLKSLVVLDLGKGRVGAVSYNSSAPPSARLNEIPFSIEAATNGDENGGLAGVLSQFQGARVAVSIANRTITGSILTIGERQLPGEKDKTPITSRTLVLAAESGELQSFDLNEIRSVKLLDEGSRQDITQFASASASARRRDAKTITVTSDGEGQREMVVSYTIAAPIWKTTYRVVLDQPGKPFFQGWAVVDNVGEEDWQNVDLSLVSGTPVSFIQHIQKPLYRYRPVVPIPQDLKLNPQVYEEGEVAVSSGANNIGGSLSRSGGGTIRTEQGGQSGSSGQIQNLQLLDNKNQIALDGLAAPHASSPGISAALTGGQSGIDAAATGSEVGELFEYRVDQPITVRRDRSALIPILQTTMEGERVSVYNESTRRDRPMNGIRLKNTSDLTLEGGSLTVIDGDAYAGEALIERLKPNEQRFISFGLDLGTLVTTKFNSLSKPVYLVRAKNGVFEAHFYQSTTKTYTIINQTDKKRVVYIEHPIRQDWKLTEDTKKPASKTLNFYRFRVEMEPRSTVELPVSETQPAISSFQIANLTQREIDLFVNGNFIDAPLRAELEKLIDLKTRTSATQNRINDLEKEEAEISEDQKRLRDNIATLKNTGEAKQLVSRYIAKANNQETRLEQITKEKREATAELTKQKAELDTAIRSLTAERKLLSGS